MSEFKILERELKGLTTEYDELSVEYRSMIEKSVRLRHALDMARARATIESATGDKKTTVDVRRAEVDLQCDKQELEAHLAEGYVDAAKARLRALDTQITAVQSRVRHNMAELTQFRADV